MRNEERNFFFVSIGVISLLRLWRLIEMTHNIGFSQSLRIPDLDFMYPELSVRFLTVELSEKITATVQLSQNKF